MKRTSHYTAWAGLLALAAELSRRGYDAAITLGNTPSLDLICSSPSGTPFTVQVKSLSAANWVLIQKAMLKATSISLGQAASVTRRSNKRMHATRDTTLVMLRRRCARARDAQR